LLGHVNLVRNQHYYDVYTDPGLFTVSLHQATASACAEQSASIEKLEQEITRAVEKCASPTERRELAEKFTTAKQYVSKVLHTSNNLISVLTSWVACHESLQLAEKKFRVHESELEQRMNDLSPNEVTETTTALRHLQQDLTALDTRCEYQMKQLASCRVAVMDSVSKCRVDLRIECGTLRRAVDGTLASLRARMERRDQLTTSWTAFELRRADLMSSLEEMETRLAHTEVRESSLIGVEELDRALESVKIEIVVLGEKYDEVWSLGRSLIASASLDDDDEADRARQTLSFVAEKWEHVQRTATDMRSTVTSVVLRWNFLKEAEREVGMALESCSRVLDRGLVVSTDSDARQLLETYSVGYLELDTLAFRKTCSFICPSVQDATTSGCVLTWLLIYTLQTHRGVCYKGALTSVKQDNQVFQDCVSFLVQI